VPAPELARARALADAYVLVSQSGSSTEVLAALEELDGAPTYAVGAHADAPVARQAGCWLPLGPLEDSAVSTLGYTATVQALGLLAEAILDEQRDPSWERIPELAHATLERHDAAAAELGAALAQAHALDAVGGGAGIASAGEAALLGREALRLPAMGTETRQYLHGPLEAVDERFACILFGGERELELSRALAGYGARVCTVSERSPAHEEQGIFAFRVPAVAETASPILQILPVQLAVAHAAALRGLAIDSLRRQQADTKVAAAP